MRHYFWLDRSEFVSPVVNLYYIFHVHIIQVVVAGSSPWGYGGGSAFLALTVGHTVALVVRFPLLDEVFFSGRMRRSLYLRLAFRSCSTPHIDFT